MTNFDIEKLKDNGFICIKNFFTIEEVEFIKSIIRFQCDSKGKKNNYFSVKYLSVIFKFLSFRYKQAYNHFKLLSLIKKKKLNLIANEYFSSKTKLTFIDGYISKMSKEAVLPWHTDKAYSGEGDINKIKKFHSKKDLLLKFFLYLTSVGPGDGCTSYILKTHKIGKAIREGIFSGELNYSPYWSIRQFIDFIKIKKNYNFLKSQLDDKKIIDDFLLDEKKIEDNKISTYDFFAEAGDLIIFDEGGIHRGSAPVKSDRIVMRFSYSQI